MKKIAIKNLILAVVLVLNIFIFHSPILGVILGLVFIILSSYLLSKILKNNLLFGFLLFLCVVILPLTLIYYFYQLNDWIISGFLILFSLILLFLNKKNNYKLQVANYKLQPHYSFLIYLVLLVISYFLLKSGVTLEPVRTPWYFISKWFFVFYFLSTVVLIYLIKRLKTVYALILSSLHLFFTFSIANIIFPLGFGFDPFIHQATEKYILEHGFILPKPFYYLGQYSLVVFLTKLFQISHVVIDKILVPLLSAILLPSVIWYAFKDSRFKIQDFLLRQGYGGQARFKNIIIFLFLIIPFTIFTFTTPQNLGDLLVIIIAFLGLSFLINNQQSTINNKFLFLMILMALTILFIHPIAGIASIIFLLVILTQKCKVNQWLKNIFYVFLCFSVFCVFVLFSLVSRFSISFVNNFNLINFYNNIFRWSPDLFWFPSFTHLLKSIAYFFYQPVVLFIMILLLAIYLLRKKLSVTHLSAVALAKKDYPLLITSIILFINSMIIFSFLKFPFLIQYEQGDFSSRIFNLGVYFLIPLALLGAWQLIIKVLKYKNIKVLIILLIAGGVTTSLYFSYPRQDVYYYTRGFNTSVYDFNAIKYLDEITEEDYVVLANQQVGAGALSTFGFRYFDNKYFFYSIPTGGELYQIYWNIVYQDAGRDEIKKASELTGAKTIYVYFPDYWFNLEKMTSNLMHDADQTMILENGRIWIFKFSY